MSVPLKERHPNVGSATTAGEQAIHKQDEPKLLKLFKYNRQADQPEVEFVRGAMLGKGAFAVCYELKQTSTNQIYAGKITAKSKLKTENARKKLLMEVKLHRELKHQHIVAVHALYEDEEHYYMLMEKCNSKTMRDVVRRKRRLEESEAKYYMIQVLDAVDYLQKLNIVHRDMKLDNIFLHDNQVKLGDFGLAAKLAPGEKKMTMCGTPNYIAPEVLAKTGHGLEVDIWAIGVILYALVVGTPPFETKAVDTTYEKIRNHDYGFPVGVDLSEHVRDLISRILVQDPAQRPKVADIRNHSFFTSTTLRPSLRTAPAEGPLAMSSQPTPIGAENHYQLRYMHAAQHNVFDQANLVGTGSHIMTRRRSLLREYGDQARNVLANIPPVEAQQTESEAHTYKSPAVLRKRKRVSDAAEDLLESKEKRQATTASVSALRSASTVAASANDQDARFNSQIIQSPSKHVRDQYKQYTSRTREPRMINDLHDQIESFISQMQNQTRPSPVRRRSSRGSKPLNRKHVWVVKWVDYSQKYGLGYQFCDGTIGVSFNDASMMVLSGDCRSVEFYRLPSGDSDDSSTRSHRDKFVKTDITVTGTLQETTEQCTDAFTKKRLALLNYFREYLGKSNKSPGLDAPALMLPQIDRDDSSSEQPCIMHWLRTKDGIVFLLSDMSGQVNFYDHCKIVVDRALQSITYVNVAGERSVMTREEALASGNDDLVKRLKFLGNVIRSFWMEKNDEQLVV